MTNRHTHANDKQLHKLKRQTQKERRKAKEKNQGRRNIERSTQQQKKITSLNDRLSERMTFDPTSFKVKEIQIKRTFGQTTKCPSKWHSIENVPK
jgi:hypothetical protein